MSLTDPHSLDFAPSAELSLGVELELQILDADSGDLAPLCGRIMESVSRCPPITRGAIVPEVTAGMIEISTGICADTGEVSVDLYALVDRVVEAAALHGAVIAGGGTHPFQWWAEQQVYDNARFCALSETYGEVLKQFTVFGQHIHLGCLHAEQAPTLMHQLARYVPHFIALSASSPFLEGCDTGYDSSRLTRPSPFPTGACAPFTLSWDELSDHLTKCVAYGVIGSIKDLHWDIRPKPEFGTVEIRVLDSPLSIERAAALGSFAQSLGAWLLTERPFVPSREDYVVYAYNKFQAARYGLSAAYIDPSRQERTPLAVHLQQVLQVLRGYAKGSSGEAHLEGLLESVTSRQNDSWLLRDQYRKARSLKELALRGPSRLAPSAAYGRCSHASRG
jgi:carboxylate-amine ligase